MYKFSAIKNQVGDDALYRFVPFNLNALQSLINHKLFFSNPHYQNDPIDSRYLVDISKFPPDHYRSVSSESSPELATKRLITVQIDSIIKKNYGICCLSKKYNNILLWSHYTSGASGFCIMFDKKKLMDSLLKSNESMEIEELTYGKIPSILPTILEKKIEFDHRQIVYFKRKEWQYESEVRIMCELKKNYLGEPFRQYEFDPKSVVCILLGERIGFEEKNTIKNILRLKGYEHVQLFKKVRDKDNPNSYKYVLQN